MCRIFKYIFNQLSNYIIGTKKTYSNFYQTATIPMMTDAVHAGDVHPEAPTVPTSCHPHELSGVTREDAPHDHGTSKQEGQSTLSKKQRHQIKQQANKSKR